MIIILLAFSGKVKAQTLPAKPDTASLAVAEIFSSRKMEAKIFPNPMKDVLNVLVENAANKSLKVQILSLSGAILLDERYTPRTDAWMLQIDATNMVNGSYFVRLLCDNEALSQKLIVHEQ